MNWNFSNLSRWRLPNFVCDLTKIQPHHTANVWCNSCRLKRLLDWEYNMWKELKVKSGFHISRASPCLRLCLSACTTTPISDNEILQHHFFLPNANSDIWALGIGWWGYLESNVGKRLTCRWLCLTRVKSTSSKNSSAASCLAIRAAEERGTGLAGK